MILTSNQGFGSWGEVFGDRIVATAILGRILHHATTLKHPGQFVPAPRPSCRGHGVQPGVGNFQFLR